MYVDELFIDMIYDQHRHDIILSATPAAFDWVAQEPLVTSEANWASFLLKRSAHEVLSWGKSASLSTA
jgi:hypothetical protein